MLGFDPVEKCFFSKHPPPNPQPPSQVWNWSMEGSEQLKISVCAFDCGFPRSLFHGDKDRDGVVWVNFVFEWGSVG